MSNNIHRTLNSEIKKDLLEGILQPIHNLVKEDNSVMFAIRDGAIHLYYRGGRLQEIVAKANGTYTGKIDKNYLAEGSEVSHNRTLNDGNDVGRFIDDVPALKNAMDRHLTTKNAEEREYQQLVVRENNNSTLSGDTEYFFTDIEFHSQQFAAAGRIDLLGAKWSAKSRGNNNSCIPVVVEMKYGTKSLKGKAGLIEHLQNFRSVLSTESGAAYRAMVTGTIVDQFNTLNELDLLNFNRNTSGSIIEISPDTPMEYVLLLSSYNPRSRELADLLDSEESKTVNTDLNDLGVSVKFFVAHFAGYAMHDHCMKTSEDIIKMLELEASP